MAVVEEGCRKPVLGVWCVCNVSMLTSYDIDGGINFAKATAKLYILHSSQRPVRKGIAQYAHQCLWAVHCGTCMLANVHSAWGPGIRFFRRSERSRRRRKVLLFSKSLTEEKTEKGWPIKKSDRRKDRKRLTKNRESIMVFKKSERRKDRKRLTKNRESIMVFKKSERRKDRKGLTKNRESIMFFKKSERRKDRKRLTKNRESIMFFKKSERRKDRKRLTKNSLSVFVAFLKASSQSGQSFAAVLWSRFWRFCTLRCGFSILFTLHLTRAQVALRLKPVLIFFFFFSSHNLKEAKHAPTPHVRSFL